jgi:hypothetical protein
MAGGMGADARKAVVKRYGFLLFGRPNSLQDNPHDAEGSTLPGTPRRVGGTVHLIRVPKGSPHLRAAASSSPRDGQFRHLGSTHYLS